MESQIEDRKGDRETKAGKRSAEEMERDRKRRSLELSRRRISNELANTRSELRKKSLQAALDHLDQELAKL